MLVLRVIKGAWLSPVWKVMRNLHIFVYLMSLLVHSVQFSSVAQSCPTLCDPIIAASQASLSMTNSWSSLKLMSFESVIPSNHLIFCHPLLLVPSIFPNIRVFSNESALASGGQNLGTSASTSVLPMNT